MQSKGFHACRLTQLVGCKERMDLPQQAKRFEDNMAKELSRNVGIWEQRREDYHNANCR
jgi:hypothetical protein